MTAHAAVSAAAIHLGALIAQADPAAWLTPETISVTGVLVVGLYMFSQGKLVSQRQNDRDVARADAAEAEVRRLNAYIAEQIVPSVTRNTDALAAILRDQARRMPDADR